MFEVEDTGIGIAGDELEKVFHYFEQTSGGRKSQTGTGLGMAISREYARLMGGDITVSSREGMGSTFRFDIRVPEGDESEVEKKTGHRRVIGLEAGREIPRILVAEDRPESLNLLVRLLETVGFRVRGAADGKQALAVFEKWRPDFIWMDIRMPQLDGLEATRRIKATEAGRAVFVAALTAHALEEEREVIMAAGCDDLVRKPFREHEIFDVMAKHLGLTYVYDTEGEPPVPVESEMELKPEHLAALPADLRRRLYRAVIELDTERTMALIELIAEQDVNLAETLKRYAKKLDYEYLLGLLDNAECPKNPETGENHGQ